MKAPHPHRQVTQSMSAAAVSPRCEALWASFGPLSGSAGPLRADLPIQYGQLLAHHPQVRQRKQRDPLRGVLLQPAVAQLDIMATFQRTSSPASARLSAPW